MPDQPEHLPLSFDQLDQFDNAALAQKIANYGSRFLFDIPLGSVGITNDPGDIAEDHIDAAFFSEKVVKYCQSIQVEPIHPDRGMLMRFTINPSDIPALIAELRRIQPWFDSENRDPDDALRDEVQDFFDNFLNAKLCLPELGDSYMANFMGSSYFYENRDELQEKYPTWQYDYWRSFACEQLKVEMYTSNFMEGTWIVLAGRSTVERLLEEDGGFTASGARLHDAISLHVNDFPHLLISPQAVMPVPSSRLGKAVACWENCIAPDLARSYNNLFESSVPGHWPKTPAEIIADRVVFHEKIDHFEQKRRGSWEYRYGFKWSMTENGDALVCGDDNVSFVAFSTSVERRRPDALRDITVTAEHALELLRDHSGIKPVEGLDWKQLTPEQFEDFCYDIILRTGRFDETRMRKHGKTRSRDGGRDIEAWTLPRFGEPISKWIFQCKLITSEASLSGAKVAISDVVDQYSAKGFGVMTNQVIDSTLYDKLDAIAKNRTIEIDTWDGRRLQRFISVRPDLMKRYFPNGSPIVTTL